MIRFAFLVTCTLASCSEQAIGSPSSAACDSALWDRLIGQSSDTAQEIPDPKRILPPGSVTTKDYRLNRTNVDLDATGIIARIWCG